MNLWANHLLGRTTNYVVAAVSAALLLFNCVTVAKQPQTIDLSEYTLLYADEFNGTELNTDIWEARSTGLRKGGYWSEDQVSVKNGCLTIRTEYKKNGTYGSGWYSAALRTKREFRYGYYECRCILPKGQGLWSAFWLTNGNVNKALEDASLGMEIDVFESPYYCLGGKNSWKVSSNLHYNGYELKSKYENVCISVLDNDPYENFNTYGVLWMPDGYTFYVNGHEVGHSDFGGVSQEWEYMILSTEVDGAAGTPSLGWSGNINLNGKSSFKSDFVVDYVRLYGIL